MKVTLAIRYPTFDLMINMNTSWWNIYKHKYGFVAWQFGNDACDVVACIIILFIK